MSESESSTKFGGVFQNKSDQSKVGNPSAATKQTKKKKHIRLPSVSFPKDWRFQNYKAADGSRPRTDAVGMRLASSAAVPPIESEKPRHTRRRLPFRKRKATEKPGLHLAAQHFLPEESNEELKSNKVTFETAIEVLDGSEKGNEENVASVRSEDEEKEAFLALLADAVPKELVSDVTTNIQDPADIFSPETYPDVNCLAIIPNPEGYSDLVAVKTVPITGLAFNSVNTARSAVISSISQFEIRLFVRDFSLAKLVGLWSVIVSTAGDSFRQLLLYFVSPLIKRYPQCFKIQVKKRKRRSKCEGEAKVHTTQVQSITNEY